MQERSIELVHELKPVVLPPRQARHSQRRIDESRVLSIAPDPQLRKLGPY